MSERKYIGARYVPLFADPLQWNNTRAYEPLTIVLNNGNSYTSRQYVPIGIDIANSDYWALSADYNAAIQNIDNIIPSNEFSSANTVKDYIDAGLSTVDAEIDALAAKIPDTDFTSTNTVKAYIDDGLSVEALASVRAFDTVADMQAAANLENGMVCHTNGFHASGDGGAAYYKVSSTGTANGMDVLACGNLFATLIITEPYVTPEQFGAYGDGTHDDTDIIEYAVSTNLEIVGDNVYNVDNLTIGFSIVPEDAQQIAIVKLHKIVSTATNAVCLKGCVNFAFDYIENTVGNGIAFVGNTFDSSVHGTRITAKQNGIDYNTSNNSCWVQYTEFNIKQIKADGNALNVMQSGNRWFNSNRFIDCCFTGTGWGAYLSNTGTGQIDENTFTGISFESSANGMYCSGTSRTMLTTCRAQEVSGTRLKLDSSNRFCDLFIGVAKLSQIDLSTATGSSSIIRGTFVNEAQGDVLFDKISINGVTNTNLQKYYANVVYHRVSSLEKFSVWANQDGTVFDYCEAGIELRNNPDNKNQCAAQKIYVDSRGGATINFNSAVLKYLGTMELVSDIANSANFTSPVNINIDGTTVKSVNCPCSFAFINDYRKIMTW